MGELTRIVLVRHGEAVVNVTRVVGGPRGDTGLTALGVTQAQRLRERLVRAREFEVDAALASTLSRARQTAEIALAARAGELRHDAALEEIRVGVADGMTFADAVQRWGMPDLHGDPDRAFCPGAESFNEFQRRVRGALSRIAREYAGRTVMVFTHGGVVDLSFAAFFDLPEARAGSVEFSTRHTSLTVWVRREPDGRWRLERYNDAAHLTG